MQQSVSQVVELVANLDDVTGEGLAAAVEALLAEGALDVWSTPIVMKKGRPGVMLSVLARVEDRQRTAERMVALTGTFGVRHRQWDRLVVERRHETVDTRFGRMRLKVGTLGGRVVAAKPEYDDAKRLADAGGVDVAMVLSVGRGAAAEFLQRCRDQGQ